MFREVTHCRICGNPALHPVLNLGDQALTGVFHRDPDNPVTRGPLELVRCAGGPAPCGLVQLRHSYALAELYGPTYGYRSGLNGSMREHLRKIAGRLSASVALSAGDLVVDIGSNDGTLLAAYPYPGADLVGIDPLAERFRSFYPPHVGIIPDFFSAKLFQQRYGARRAKIVTSISMFYDLESPLDFMREIHEILDYDGVWHFEQSYLPAMLSATAYDTICHEHLEYYGLRQIKYMTDRCGLKIVGVEQNSVNGGSFAITAARTESPYPEPTHLIDEYLKQESVLATEEPYRSFEQAVFSHRTRLLERLAEMRAAKQLVLGYGASTKGNVILQFCGIGPEELPAIAEVNEQKFGCYTPGQRIPIISEAEAHARHPDCFLVLPWHFKQNLIDREREFLRGGGRLLFPLPEIEFYAAGKS